MITQIIVNEFSLEEKEEAQKSLQKAGYSGYYDYQHTEIHVNWQDKEMLLVAPYVGDDIDTIDAFDYDTHVVSIAMLPDGNIRRN
jgi:hypothetical protein